MPLIRLETVIRAPVERVFDLARSIDAHTASAEGTRERAVGGRTSGLIGPDETVTWEARHLGIRQRLTVRITGFDRPHRFTDEMIRGAFQSMRHNHRFQAEGDRTRMSDEFSFTAPLGIFGRLAEKLFLEAWLERFLRRRNQALKVMAESDQWQRYLTTPPGINADPAE